MTAYQKIIGSVLLVMLLATAFLATPGRVHGSVIVAKAFDEINTNTDAICTLREAIIAANTNTPYGGCPAGTGTNDEIYLEPGNHVLRLGGSDETGHVGDLDITEGVSIYGTGTTTTVWASFPTGHSDRIFHVKSSTKVSISNMTLKGGDATSYAAGGGAILNDSGSDLSLSYLTINGNTAGTTSQGGGITNKTTAKLTINTSTISGNFALFGAGIYNEGLLRVTNSLISSNQAASTGGGLDNNSQALTENATLINTTVTKNIAPAGGGGGISNSGTLILLYDSIANNDKEGIALEPGSKVTFQNSIISGQGSYNCVYDNGAVTDLDYNLEDNTANTCRLTPTNQGSHNKIGPSPLFVVDSSQNPLLAYNGGPTQTYALQLTSPAIDAIPLGSPSCGGSDQRLYGRGGDGGDANPTPGCDIGAYEKGGTLYQLFAPVVAR